MSNSLRRILFGLGIIAAFVLLWQLSQASYPIFHTVVEFFSIAVASALFIIAWNSRENSENPILVLLGIAYLFIAVMDFFHTIAYEGMQLFPRDIFYANQMWIATRFVESISLLLFAMFSSRNINVSYYPVFIVYGIVSSVLMLSIFLWKVFPVCFIAGEGQTTFKIVSEYVIIGILGTAIVFGWKKRQDYKGNLFKVFVFSVILTILSELSFTLYADNFGFFNTLGHYLKLISFYLIYRAVIVNLLQKPVETLFNRLQTSEKELREANETKNKFFSIIAHDLRNPFNSLLGFSDILLKRFDTLSDEDKKQFIGLLNQSANNTFKLLQNLLDWAKLQFNKMKPEFSDLPASTVIGGNVSLLKEMAERKNIVLKGTYPAGSMVYGDMYMITTVVRNLVTNAIKFTLKGGTVFVILESREKGVVIHVKDSGIGISPEIKEKLFSIEHIRSSPGTENEMGTGLGLILCKEFLEKHNGSISIESTPGEGTTFSVFLPGKKG